VGAELLNNLSPGINAVHERLDFFARHALKWATFDRQSVRPGHMKSLDAGLSCD